MCVCVCVRVCVCESVWAGGSWVAAVAAAGAGVCATTGGGVVGKVMGCKGVGSSMGIGLGFFVSTYVGLGEGSSVGSYVGGSSEMVKELAIRWG